MEKFSYETNGYNRSEVNQFISDVIKETESIISRVKKQSTEIEDLNCQVVYIVNNFIDRNIKAQVINNRSNISIMLIEDKLFNDFANKIAPINAFMMDKKKIVLVGNPVYNTELWNLYKKAILQLK